MSKTHFRPNLRCECVFSGEADNTTGMRHLSDYWIGSNRTHVFTDTVRSCKCVFELVLDGFAELTATPLATPLAKVSSALVFP